MNEWMNEWMNMIRVTLSQKLLQRHCEGPHAVAVLRFTFFWGGRGEGSGWPLLQLGGTDLYCHSEPPLTSGKLCFIINFIGGTGEPQFLLGAAPSTPPFEPPLATCIFSWWVGEQTPWLSMKRRVFTLQHQLGERGRRRGLTDIFPSRSVPAIVYTADVV